jgi:hypothetical protein
MSARRKLPGLLSALFLLNATFAESASQAYPVRIKVISAETRALNAEAQVPKDCDLQNFSAYCNESRSPSAQNIMLVQDSEGKSFRIACTIDSRWSKCSPLPVGETFEARNEKHGFTVLYRNAKGKEAKQLYQVVGAVLARNSGTAADTQPQAAAPPENPPIPESAPPAGSPQEVLPEKVTCKFSSTPSRAEITLDGRYVGNTPSEIGLSTGTHLVVVSMPGFAQWKRELTIAAHSAVNVTARLQKMRP